MKATTTIDQAQARAEQQSVEATIEYRIEQELNAAFKLIEDELFALEESEAEVAEVEAMRRAGLHDEYRAAAQERNATKQCADGSYW